MPHALPFADDEFIQTEIWGQVGFITLNRPKALNALTLGMVRAMLAALLQWRENPAIVAVVLRGCGKNGPFGVFCAGGDIRCMHEAACNNDPGLEDFFTEEYLLDHQIHHYPKPVIALMDGVVMGGGMGISQGARYRIVTERSRLAMPETLIGFFPDVGASWFLKRCPGHTGEWLALTGAHVGAQDAVALGLADAVLPSGVLPALWQALQTQRFAHAQAVQEWMDAWMAAHRVAPGDLPAPWLSDAMRAQIDHFFALPNARDIVLALESHVSPWAQATAAELRKRSPFMLWAVLEQIRRGRALGLAETFRQDRNLTRQSFYAHPTARHEALEGIRALVVDKDNQPRWRPARVEDVCPDEVNAYFSPVWPAVAHPLRTLADPGP